MLQYIAKLILYVMHYFTKLYLHLSDTKQPVQQLVYHAP